MVGERRSRTSSLGDLGQRARSPRPAPAASPSGSPRAGRRSARAPSPCARRAPWRGAGRRRGRRGGAASGGRRRRSAGLLAERRLRADRMRAALGHDLARVAVPGERGQLLAGRLAEKPFERPCLASRPAGRWCVMPFSASLALVTGPTPHISSTGSSCRKREFGRRIDDDQPVGLGDLRGDLGEVLGARDADRDRQAELVADAAPDLPGDLGSASRTRCSQPATSAKASSIEMRSTSGVKSPRTAIAASPSRWYSSKWPPTKRSCGQSSRAAPAGHAAAHAERLGLVGGGQHHAAADRDRLAAQRRIEQLLDRGVERVEVGMEDGSRHDRARATKGGGGTGRAVA